MTGHGGFAFLWPIMNDGEELRRDEYGKKSVDEFIVIHDRMPTRMASHMSNRETIQIIQQNLFRGEDKFETD